MAWRPDGGDWALAAALLVMALAARAPLLHTPPYGDESLFFQASAHPAQVPAGITQADGRPIFYPTSLNWERPLFYAIFWLPAQFGFTAFRLSHMVVASLLAPLAYALLRTHGGRRGAGAAAGVAVATVPLLVVWGAYGLTDSVMTLFLGAALWARAEQHHLLMGALLLAAAWTKEEAWAAVALLFAWDLLPALRRREASLWPLQLGPRLSACAWPLAIGLFPFLYAVAHGFPAPRGAENVFEARVLDEVYLTPWLVPVLVAGTVAARSRWLAGFGLGAGGFLLALHILVGFSVQSWYEVPAAFFALVGAAAAGDALLDAGRQRAPHVRAASVLPAALAACLVAALVLVPAGASRNLLHPLHGDGGNSLGGTYVYETSIRDRTLLGAYAAIPLDGQHDLVAIDLFHAHLYTLAPRTHHLWYDAASSRDLLLRSGPLAHRIEANGTWTLVAKTQGAFNQAVRAVYHDCAVLENADYAVYRGWLCAGRAAQLEAATAQA